MEISSEIDETLHGAMMCHKHAVVKKSAHLRNVRMSSPCKRGHLVRRIDHGFGGGHARVHMENRYFHIIRRMALIHFCADHTCHQGIDAKFWDFPAPVKYIYLRHYLIAFLCS